jgi:hypothetical protein
MYSKSEQENISNREIEDIIEQYELEMELKNQEVMDAESQNPEPRA